MKVYKIYDTISKEGFSLNSVLEILDECKNEKDIYFDIDTIGGSVSEGFAIYDELRMCGKRIHMNIKRNCHSIGMIILLAAPYEYRSGNQNIRALIHEVSNGIVEGDYTTSELERMYNEIKLEEQEIARVHSERTELSFDNVIDMMQKEKFCTAEELLRFGYISKINNYKNFNRKKMGKNLFSKKFFAAWKNEAKNYEFTDYDGNVLFTTERDDNQIHEGDVVVFGEGNEDGTYILPDGRVVIIEDNIVVLVEEVDEIMNKYVTLSERYENLSKDFESIKNEVEELKTNKISNYQPQNRLGGRSAGDKKAQYVRTIEEKREGLKNARKNTI